jgi:hypothetical protein
VTTVHTQSTEQNAPVDVRATMNGAAAINASPIISLMLISLILLRNNEHSYARTSAG